MLASSSNVSLAYFVESELTREEREERYRSDIVALLSRNPHCPLAQLLGQRLMDLYEEIYP